MPVVFSIFSGEHYVGGDTKDSQLALLDCAVITGADGSLETEIYKKHAHTVQYLLFD